MLNKTHLPEKTNIPNNLMDLPQILGETSILLNQLHRGLILLNLSELNSDEAGKSIFNSIGIQEKIGELEQLIGDMDKVIDLLQSESTSTLTEKQKGLNLVMINYDAIRKNIKDIRSLNHTEIPPEYRVKIKNSIKDLFRNVKNLSILINNKVKSHNENREIKLKFHPWK